VRACLVDDTQTNWLPGHAVNPPVAARLAASDSRRSPAGFERALQATRKARTPPAKPMAAGMSQIHGDSHRVPGKSMPRLLPPSWLQLATPHSGASARTRLERAANN
jgi:hypothetical protein